MCHYICPRCPSVRLVKQKLFRQLKYLVRFSQSLQFMHIKSQTDEKFVPLSIHLSVFIFVYLYIGVNYNVLIKKSCNFYSFLKFQCFQFLWLLHHSVYCCWINLSLAHCFLETTLSVTFKLSRCSLYWKKIATIEKFWKVFKLLRELYHGN